MSEADVFFPDYGDTRDLAGARRARRAFRLCILTVVILTFFLWIAERFLQYEQTEYLYLSALTLPKESGRVMLQQSIKIDAETQKRPNPKFTQALAVREEDDVILSTYERGHKMDPTNSLFSVRYGCRLFLMGYPKEARDKFLQASNHQPPNALPKYLEAACIVREKGDEEALNEAMVLTARTNNGGENIIFPRPMWFSKFSETGHWYARLQREIVDESCAPLYRFSRTVIETAEQKIKLDQTRIARTWLGQLETMGKRLTVNSEPAGSLQAMAGIGIRLQAMALLAQIGTSGEENPNPSLVEEKLKLTQALDQLKAFESTRDARIQDNVEEHVVPLRLSFFGLAAVSALYALLFMTHKLMRLRKTAWTVPHSTNGLVIVWGGALVLLLLLHALTVFQRIPGTQEEYRAFITTAWWGTIGILVLFGWAYPGMTLKSVSEVSRKGGRVEEMSERLPPARRAYRRAYISMLMRYYGILGGAMITTICLWIVSYRIFIDLYPWQVDLLASGLAEDEMRVLRQVLALIG